MTRILFWLALAFLVTAAIRSKLKGAMRGQEPQRRAPPPGKDGRRAAEPGGQVETMLCCAQCGVYFPASEAVKAEGRDFCSPAHARLPAP